MLAPLLAFSATDVPVGTCSATLRRLGDVQTRPAVQDPETEPLGRMGAEMHAGIKSDQ
jgi:hypothetical protein